MLLLLFSHQVLSDAWWPHGPPVSIVHGFSRQEYWSALPFPSPGNLLNPGTEPAFPALTGRFFTTEPSVRSIILSWGALSSLTAWRKASARQRIACSLPSANTATRHCRLRCWITSWKACPSSPRNITTCTFSQNQALRMIYAQWMIRWFTW